MRTTLTLLFLSITLFSASQEKDSSKTISTTGIFDTMATKSGYSINGYYVELSEAEFKKYKGKKVKVTGKLLVVPGLDPNDPVIKQGSMDDRKFIVEPKIEIIYNRGKKK
jgi:hypothetical protein